MRIRHSLVLVSVSALLVAAWIGAGRPGEKTRDERWKEIAPGILRTPGIPTGHALVDGDAALLVDAPLESRFAPKGISKIEGILLTHYHRGVCAAAGSLLEKGVKVRAPRGADEWLSTEGVRKYWQTSLPLRNSRTAYLVVPEGFEGIVYDLADGKDISWRGWKIRVVAIPGHARAHVALAARKGTGPLALFCGGALAAPGKLWAPYTTDWDHWTDAGLVPAAESLRKLAALKPDILLPSYGPAIGKWGQDSDPTQFRQDRSPAATLNQTAVAVEEVGFLKSFERFTKQRLGNAPSYRFLAKEQATSNGSLPWSQVSPHLFLTGNTYVLTSKDGTCLMIDPWDKRSADQFAKLQREQKVGPLEVVMFSHAHYDHYDGIYYLPGREKFEVWTLDQVAGPIAEPLRWRAPFLDARPLKIDRRPREGDTLTWREYRFRFHFLPGQSRFTMGVEATIDGRRCYFTADNFFHQDMFSGSGGWMGLNRSSPLPYAASAQKVLDAAPEWVLAEHGGPFEFNAEDFRRRVQWGKVSARAADAICLSGNHRQDWDPHRIHVEPLVQPARPGDTMKAHLVATGGDRDESLSSLIEGRGYFEDQTIKLEVPVGETVRRSFAVRLSDKLPRGRHVFVVHSRKGDILHPADAFLAVDVDRLDR
jgi:glyoxylase-like metal-dependent hydrolase (beta-lactamase superfamily II)